MTIIWYHSEHRILPVLSSATLQVASHAPYQILQMHFLLQASGDMLDDGKYQCNIKDELAQKLAHNLRINLDSYLLYI